MAYSVKGNMDIRSVLRGKCSQCECVSYYSPPGLKCSCGHPPSKHEKVEDKMEVDHTVAYGICDMESCGNAVHCDPLQEKQKNLHFCSQCQEILSQRKYLIESMQDSSSLVSNYSSIHVAFDPSYSFASERQLRGERIEFRNCIVEPCDNRVHIDHELPPEIQQFQYCSKNCRDTHLDYATEKMRKNITLLERSMHEKVNDHIWSEYKTSNLGPCRSCFERSKSEDGEFDGKAGFAVLGDERMAYEQNKFHQKYVVQQCLVCDTTICSCQNPSHHMQGFHYCSPQCRDQDLLKVNSKKIKENIMLLEASLKGEHTINEKWSEYAARNAGPCATCEKRKSSDKNSKNKPSHSNSVAKGAEQKEQDSVIVIIPKNSLVEDLGIIVSSEAYSTSRVLICGYVVTGIELGKAAFREMSKNDGIHLFDIIKSVNDVPITTASLSTFTRIVQLECDKKHGILLDSEVLSKVRNYTHIFGIKCSGQSKIGVFFQAVGDEVGYKVSEDTIAIRSGLKCNDIIRGYFIYESKTEIVEHEASPNFKDCRLKLKECCDKVKQQKLTLILFIKRRF